MKKISILILLFCLTVFAEQKYLATVLVNNNRFDVFFDKNVVRLFPMIKESTDFYVNIKYLPVDDHNKTEMYRMILYRRQQDEWYFRDYSFIIKNGKKEVDAETVVGSKWEVVPRHRCMTNIVFVESLKILKSRIEK